MLTPLAGVMLVWLLLVRSPGCAAWWVIASASCAGLTAVLKISFRGCPPTPDLAESAGLRRVMTMIGSAGFIVSSSPLRHLVCCSLSAPEVGLGLVIGISSLTLFCQGYLRCRAARMRLSPLFVSAGAVLLVLHGRELDAEHFLPAIAEWLRIRCA